ncbi:MAG: hypothetical protein A3F78_10455 [Burkholderiales bacterium RIFCSPLOWO2_12_FULL_61_40]|nr:MAG: hypothetical protein A3F78_10455 [Burkholderiales bacterium RIFCSPLOWO2_12_FULL_61_40]
MYKKLLVVVDDRAVTQSAIWQGIELARFHRADIFFFCVLPKNVFSNSDLLQVGETSPDEFERTAREHATRLLADASALAEGAGVFCHTATGIGADDAQCVSEAANHRHCDLIVVGTEGHNAVVRLLTGSIVSGLISIATVPVLVCRDTEATRGSGRRASVAIRAKYRRDERRERRERHAGEEND